MRLSRLLHHALVDHAPHRHARPRPPAPGEVRWAPARSLFFTGHALVFTLLAVPTFSWGAVAAAGATTLVCLCLGHSVGLHRGLIHRTFKMHRTTGRILAWLATLTGIGPVLRLMGMHDIRDRWQNQACAPAYYAYDHGWMRDFWWYLHCRHRPLPGDLEPEIPADHAADPVLAWLDRTWMLQQVPVALALFAALGWGGVVWAVCGRVLVSSVGHWLVNHICHTRGTRRYAIDGSGEEGRNNILFGALSMGEGWHNNHHAWPDSARFGVAWYELDPGWLALCGLRCLGLAWDVQTQETVAVRETARERGETGAHAA